MAITLDFMLPIDLYVSPLYDSATGSVQRTYVAGEVLSLKQFECDMDLQYAGHMRKALAEGQSGIRQMGYR